MAKKIIFWSVVAIVAIAGAAAWYFLWYKPRQTSPPTPGSSCMAGNRPGTYNYFGLCVPSIIHPDTNTARP